ncbi:MAG TPA: hypothetical protein VF588_01360 [Pyrinomonadaceae bacterium]|jgi:hypothetical protein
MNRFLALTLLCLGASLTAQAQQFNISTSGATPKPAFVGSLWQTPDPSRAPAPSQRPAYVQEEVYAEPTEEAEDPVGDFKISYGYQFNDRSRSDPSGSRDMAGPFSFGVTLHPRLSIEFGFDTFLSSKAPGTPRTSGAGDMSLTTEFVAAEEKGSRPALSFVYTVGIPNASVDEGLGSGRFDHLVLAVLSNGLGEEGKNGTIGVAFGPSFAGKSGESGYVTAGRLTLSYGYKFQNGLGYGGRVAGKSRGGGKPSVASTTHALSYDFAKRYSVEAGVLAGLTSNAPRVGFFTSLTVSGNLRKIFK